MKAFILIIACLTLSVYGLPSSRIVGGDNAQEGQYPYQISLRYNNIHICGGSVISNRYILTAAHCVYDKENYPFMLSVATGSVYLDKPGNVYQVVKVITHPGWNGFLRIHDIALVRVSREIEFKNVQPISLPTADRNYDNYPLVATGWGRLKAWGPVPNHLQEIIVKGYSQERCKQDYGNIMKTHVCTLTMYGQGMCNGDSGGPLVTDNVLVGIVSYGTMPCASGRADVYTRVFHYKSWINQYTLV